MSLKILENDIVITWCHNKIMVPILADFFVANVDIKYISHGELQDGRALDTFTWSPNIKNIISKEIELYIGPGFHKNSHGGVAFASFFEEIIAFLFVQISKDESSRFATIADLIVKRNFRNQGIGKKILSWMIDELKTIDIRRIFLESGKNNKDAHKFFEFMGFEQCSIVMLKE